VLKVHTIVDVNDVHLVRTDGRLQSHSVHKDQVPFGKCLAKVKKMNTRGCVSRYPYNLFRPRANTRTFLPEVQVQLAIGDGDLTICN